MLFSRTKVDYGDTPYPETPFQKVAQLVDAQNGAREAQTANWRYIAFGCLGLAFLSTGGFIWSESQSSITPYVVEVDKLGGVQAVAPAEVGYEPGDEPPSQQQNRRNGQARKTVKGSDGAVLIDVPRDRDGYFEPQLIGKGQTLSLIHI